jgi:hypothetical protein
VLHSDILVQPGDESFPHSSLLELAKAPYVMGEIMR